ncbi:hypothetical protein E2C01_070523 [Portunus trituberculatus]|uniref:Uncharacterized protein n=1 Tax=Portunus trituberculatus TaxID=210409 RepID=A0A5B7I5H2_PORTR|nr:hypothetical protein [Portunus trituberculatus]
MRCGVRDVRSDRWRHQVRGGEGRRQQHNPHKKRSREKNFLSSFTSSQTTAAVKRRATLILPRALLETLGGTTPSTQRFYVRKDSTMKKHPPLTRETKH